MLRITISIGSSVSADEEPLGILSKEDVPFGKKIEL